MKQYDLTMSENYMHAAPRHFQDGCLLEENHRVANADQLFGFAAECAIKSALVSLPGFMADGRLLQAHRKHVNQLWSAACVQSIQRRYPALLSVLKGLPQAFDDWSTDQRYEPNGVVTDEAINRHRKAATRVLGSVGLYGVRGET